MKLSFKTFLLESWRSTIISRDEALDFMRAHCSEALSKDDPVIFRGVANHTEKPEYHLSKPSNFTRQSKNTSNYYTLIIDNDPAWAKYPKRSKSLICTNRQNVNYTEGFGTAGIVIPVNGAKIGQCPEFDFWESFNELGEFGISNMANFNFLLSKTWEGTGFRIPHDVSDYKDMKMALEFGNDSLQDPEEEHSDRLQQVFKTVISGKETLTEFVHRILDPKINDFTLTNIKNLNPTDDTAREIWTDADSIILIPNESFDRNKLDQFYRDIKNEI